MIKVTVAFNKVTIGLEYDRIYLAKLWDYRDWHAIGRGVVTPSRDNKIILFITKVKQKALTQYLDYFEDDLLYMEGESNHASDTRIVNSVNANDEIHLFYREIHHTPFTYYGRIYLATYILFPDVPSKFVFSTPKFDKSATELIITEEIG